MKILAIDPGYERLGVAVIEKNEKSKENLVFSECFQTSSKLDFTERLLLLGEEVRYIIKKYKPEVLAIEKLYFNSNQKTAIQVAQATGGILLLAKQSDLQIFEYTPLQIKLAVAGNGRGTKKDVINMVHHLLEIKKDIKLDDEYDAVAIGLTCLASERF